MSRVKVTAAHVTVPRGPGGRGVGRTVRCGQVVDVPDALADRWKALGACEGVRGRKPKAEEATDE